MKLFMCRQMRRPLVGFVAPFKLTDKRTLMSRGFRSWTWFNNETRKWLPHLYVIARVQLVCMVCHMFCRSNGIDILPFFFFCQTLDGLKQKWKQRNACRAFVELSENLSDWFNTCGNNVPNQVTDGCIHSGYIKKCFNRTFNGKKNSSAAVILSFNINDLLDGYTRTYFSLPNYSYYMLLDAAIYFEHVILNRCHIKLKSIEQFRDGKKTENLWGYTLRPELKIRLLPNYFVF